MSERQFVSGETFLYLGRQARLILAPTAERATGVRLVAGRLVVPVTESLSGRERAAAVRKQLIAWYRAHAAERLPERVEPWRTRLGIAPASLLIRSQEKRWASCAANGILRFNWRIIQVPVSLNDYVLAHELVHLLHRHHTPDFWATLGACSARL